MKMKLTRNLLIVMGMDALLICVSFYFAHIFRFDFSIPAPVWKRFLEMLPLVILGKWICLYCFDGYRGMWRYTSTKDILSLVRANSFASIGLVVLFLFINRFDMVARSVFVIDWCVSIILLVGLRIGIRLCFEAFTEQVSFVEIFQVLGSILFPTKGRGKGVIIIGAGDLGQKICREFIENPYVQSHVAGVLDDDPFKLGKKIHGIPVLAEINHLQDIVRITGARDVIIAISRLTTENMRRIVDICQKARVNFKTVPSMGEVVDGRLRISAIRQVEYRDLLGREEIHLDEEKIGEYIGQKTVLVTGAGGSIGSELCRQICRYQPEKIILFERAESPLYDLEMALKQHFSGVTVLPVLGDILNREELYGIVGRFSPTIIFHAAAYKHVPLLEEYPWKAVEHIIGGTRNILEAAWHFHCPKLVFISTDKAVNPTNVMGACKRIAEILAQQPNACPQTNLQGTTCVITVRFGNVIGSAGSVIPLFKRQIREGGPVTVTHKDMTRYFMLIPEACQLILQAGAMGIEGQIFLLEMGEPVHIESMARDLIRFSGLQPDTDIKIAYTGLRPGEKLYEELMSEKEHVESSSHDKIMVLKTFQPGDMPQWHRDLHQLFHAAEDKDCQGIQNLLAALVPEYTPDNRHRG